MHATVNHVSLIPSLSHRLDTLTGSTQLWSLSHGPSNVALLFSLALMIVILLYASFIRLAFDSRI